MYKGKILISNFTLVNDLEFNKAVILIVKNDNEGTIGFILNKKSNYLLSDINSGSKELNIPIYKGGPVMMDTLHFIHKKTKLFKKSIKITNEIFWGNEFEKAVQLLSDKKINPKEIKFFIGYSGWDDTQLENEVDEKSWLITKTYSTKEIFDFEKLLWKNSLEKFGDYYKLWSNSPENPNHN